MPLGSSCFTISKRGFIKDFIKWLVLIWHCGGHDEEYKDARDIIPTLSKFIIWWTGKTNIEKDSTVRQCK